MSEPTRKNLARRWTSALLLLAGLVVLVWIGVDTLTSEPPAPAPTPAPSGPDVVGADRPVLKHAQEKTARLNGAAFDFVERRYDPPFLVERHPERPDLTTMTTPEALMAAYTSSMAAGDWDWWRRLWDRDSRRYFAELMLDHELTADTFRAGWKELYPGKRFVLLRRIDMPGYVVVYFRRSDSPDDDIEATQPVAMRRDTAGRWWLTHDLRDHPVYMYDAGMKDDVEVSVVTR